ncbi:MAG: putative Nudix hydrolase NudL [Candidatus Heimdallarchaeota archaeon AB_125]|nr:MAG: putative Nudix hydrolase NudL [Candidatus Heimdallarchaeota archaeon AB_125]
MNLLANLGELLEPIDSSIEAPMNFRLAAVLVPIFYEEEKILFTKRTENLSHHQGQISFPGGRYDESDGNLVETALRETQEEVGIDRKFIHILGSLNPLFATSLHYVYPLVAFVSEDVKLKLNPAEVEETFFAKIDQLMLPENHLSGLFSNQEYMYYSVGKYKIWGLTHLILTDLLKRLKRK